MQTHFFEALNHFRFATKTSDPVNFEKMMCEICESLHLKQPCSQLTDFGGSEPSHCFIVAV
jgi:hypothetical protein